MAHLQNNAKINANKEDSQREFETKGIKHPDTSQSGESQPTDMCECEQRMYKVIKSFCSHTSLHGIKYVGEKGHIAVRLLWAFVVLIAFGAAIYHICQVYSKWEETPATITVSSKAKDIKDIFFPAVTICPPVSLLTKEFAMQFLDKSHHRYNQRKNMVDKYCEIGAIPWYEIQHAYEYEDRKIWEENTKLSCDDLMEDGKYPDGYGGWNRLESYVTTSQVFVQGAALDCCTFNAYSDEMIYKNINFTNREGSTNFNTKIPKSHDLLKPTGIGTQNALVYLIQKLHCLEESSKFQVSIHHPAEAPNVEGDGLIVNPGGEISYTVKPLQTESSDDLKYLDPKDRKCLYDDEVHLRFFKHYTHWNCHLDCLANLTIVSCGCLPRYLPDNNGTLKICKGYNFSCFQETQQYFEQKRQEICQCEQPCSDLVYLVTPQYVPAEKEDKNIVKFNVYFTEPTYFGYERTEVLGLSGFLASCGGLLGLFMGFSVISMIEIFYFSIFEMWKAIFETFIMKVTR